MNPPDYQSIKRLYLELEALSPEACKDRLEEFRGRDPVLADHVRTLLAFSRDPLLPRSAAIPSATNAATPGASSADRIGHFTLLRELGRGGQAIVYLAEDTRIRDRKLAVKVMRDSSLLAPGALERFRREAEVASKLEHPGICPVYEAGVDEARPYIAMRYIEGDTLARRIQSSGETPATEGASLVIDLETVNLPGLSAAQMEPDPTPTPSGPTTRAQVMKAVWLIEGAARALHVAHEAGTVHRDVKPGNIMVTKDGEPVLMDFGLAREVEGPTLTMTGDFFGTPAYMSPEQLLAQRVNLDRRTDVWSLGVTLYECLTLRRPFESPTREGLYQAIQSKEPPDPSSLNAAVPPDLRVVLETALDKDRDRRYQTALDFAEDLRRVREFEPIAAKPASAWIRLKRWAQRNPALAGSVSAGVLFLIAGLAVALFLLAERDAALGREKQTSASLDRKVTEYDQMSDVALVEELGAQAAKLWPRRPQMLPAMAKWLHEARDAHGRLPVHEAALQELRDRAAPYDAVQQEADAEKRRQIHAELFDGIDTERRKIRDAEEAVTQLRGQIAEIETAIEEEENERTVLRHEKRKEHYEVQVEELGATIVGLREELSTLEQDPRLTGRLTWQLSDPTDRWRHQVLSRMVGELDGFGALIEDVTERQSFAESIEERSVADHQAAWDRCLADLRTNPKYAASADLRTMKPQIGLVPLGIDRDSGLWEFWHVGSGERPKWEGVDWAADASTDPRGKVKLAEDGSTGIVLILLPGGSFWMGATAELGARNYDPEAQGAEGPVHEVTLEAFFMAKYELTQAQWLGLMGDNPSQYRAGTTNFLGGKVNPLHPVTNVDWDQCGEAMRRCDLELPTEARWEYACRAGTSTVYWCGDSVVSIQDRKAGDIADKTASERTTWTFTPEVEDGHFVHAPVGSFAASAFGLHDVLGNVWEWSEDRYSSYEHPARPGDGLRDEPGSRVRARVLRGGSFHDAAIIVRSAARYSHDPSFRVNSLGCRPSRGLH